MCHSIESLLPISFDGLAKVVTPVPGFRRDRVAGVQKIRGELKILDSGFRRNDGKDVIRLFA